MKINIRTSDIALYSCPQVMPTSYVIIMGPFSSLVPFIASTANIGGFGSEFKINNIRSN